MPDKKLQRAKLFLSYDALKGFTELIREKEKKIIPKKELSADDYDELNWKIKSLKSGMLVQITYYDLDQYIQKEGMVALVDLNNKIIRIVDKEIKLKDIVKIEFM
ncbi:YolD-like family protein [Thomasclavelia sp.]|uniref:YolD-like family protein n=1 Tax=Thomasclavelia sp. TaxID=3025757 RepID=UPI0025F8BDA5|nr:YolD-like family protein [Thomasclavelia sp.]